MPRRYQAILDISKKLEIHVQFQVLVTEVQKIKTFASKLCKLILRIPFLIMH